MRVRQKTWTGFLLLWVASAVAVEARAADDLLLRTGVEPDVRCADTGGFVVVTLEVANLSESINGVQALIAYDASKLSLSSITEQSPWMLPTWTDNAGDLDFASITTNATSNGGVVATLTFNIVALDVTSVGFRPDDPPFATKLTLASDSSTISPATTNSGLIRLYDRAVDCCAPSDGALTTIADGVGCTVDACDDLTGAVSHVASNGLCDDSVGCTVDSCDPVSDCQNVASNGLCDNGLYCDGVETCDTVSDCQAGTAIDCADADLCTVDSCDEIADACVHDDATFVTVNLDVEAIGAAVTRDVTFLLTNCGGSTEEHTVPANIASDGTATVVLGDSQLNDFRLADFIRAAEGHTLSRQLPLNFTGSNGCSATADFVGTGGILVAGDFRTDTVLQDNLVDIVDFSILASRWNTPVDECLAPIDPEDCGLGADATGDGIQNLADFTAVQINFFEVGDSPDACGLPAFPETLTVPVAVFRRPRSGIRVSSLQSRVAEISRADLNGDAIIDARDILLFADVHGIALLPEFAAKLHQLELGQAPATQAGNPPRSGEILTTECR